MNRQNTLLQGFNYSVPTATDQRFQGETSTNRGRIIAVDIYAQNNNLAPQQNNRVSLSVGGQEIVNNMRVINYNVPTDQRNYQVIPLEINDGQTFNFRLDNRLTLGETRGAVIFLREGFTTIYDRNAKLSTYKIAFNDFVDNLDTTGQITGLIPKNRGNCIGFKLVSNTFPFVTTTDESLYTFIVDGVVLVENVPADVFTPLSSRPYKELYLPLMAGSTFELRCTNIDDDVSPEVQFIFEDDKPAKQSK